MKKEGVDNIGDWVAGFDYESVVESEASKVSPAEKKNRSRKLQHGSKAFKGLHVGTMYGRYTRYSDEYVNPDGKRASIGRLTHSRELGRKKEEYAIGQRRHRSNLEHNL